MTDLRAVHDDRRDAGRVRTAPAAAAPPDSGGGPCSPRGSPRAVLRLADRDVPKWEAGGPAPEAGRQTPGRSPRGGVAQDHHDACFTSSYRSCTCRSRCERGIVGETSDARRAISSASCCGGAAGRGESAGHVEKQRRCSARRRRIATKRSRSAVETTDQTVSGIGELVAGTPHGEDVVRIRRDRSRACGADASPGVDAPDGMWCLLPRPLDQRIATEDELDCPPAHTAARTRGGELDFRSPSLACRRAGSTSSGPAVDGRRMFAGGGRRRASSARTRATSSRTPNGLVR